MGHISLQFHVIFDKMFETGNLLAVGVSLDKQFADIFFLGHECFLDVTMMKMTNQSVLYYQMLLSHFHEGRYPGVLRRVSIILNKEGLQNANQFYIFD
jgi:hypothetical protein